MALTMSAKKIGLTYITESQRVPSGFTRYIRIVVTLTFGMQCSPCGNGTYLQIVPRLHETGVFLSKLDFFKKKRIVKTKKSIRVKVSAELRGLLLNA